MYVSYVFFLILSLSLALPSCSSNSLEIEDNLAFNSLEETEDNLASNSLEETEDDLASDRANPLNLEFQINDENNSSQAETQNTLFQSQKLLELQQKITDLERILSEYQAPEVNEETLLVIKENHLISYDKIMSVETDYLTKKETLNEVLKGYYVLDNIKQEVQDFRNIQEQLEQTFSDYSHVVQAINQLDLEQEQFYQRYLDLKKQIGQLDFEDIFSFIMLHKRAAILSSGESLKDNLQKTTKLISKVYSNIDNEKKNLLAKGDILADILCDSSFYKNSKKTNCLNLVAVKSKADIENFLNSLSPQQWQQTEFTFKHSREFSQDYFELPAHQRLIETLWTLSRQKVYDKFKSSWKNSDFYRWIYFVMRSQLEASEQSFSWEQIETIARNQNRDTYSESINLVIKKIELEEKRDSYAKQLTMQEDEYYNILNVLRIMFDIQRVGYKSSFQKIKPNCLVSQSQDIWIECINNYPSIMLSIQKQKQELEKSVEVMLQQILFYTPLVLNSLKTQQTQHLTIEQ